MGNEKKKETDLKFLLEIINKKLDVIYEFIVNDRAFRRLPSSIYDLSEDFQYGVKEDEKNY